MEIFYAGFEKLISYNYKLKDKPFYLQDKIVVIAKFEDGHKIYIMIDKGFQSDGCTIPKLLQIILGCPHTPEYLPAAIIHDYILEHPEIVKYDRKTASTIFFYALLKEGVCHTQAVIMYLAVDFWQWVRNFWTEKWV